LVCLHCDRLSLSFFLSFNESVLRVFLLSQKQTKKIIIQLPKKKGEGGLLKALICCCQHFCMRNLIFSDIRISLFWRVNKSFDNNIIIDKLSVKSTKILFINTDPPIIIIIFLWKLASVHINEHLLIKNCEFKSFV